MFDSASTAVIPGYLHTPSYLSEISPFSVKYLILSLFSDLSYEDLEINQGLLAVQKYRELEETNSDEIREQLYQYCGLDTYAEYVLYHYLLDVVKE